MGGGMQFRLPHAHEPSDGIDEQQAIRVAFEERLPHRYHC